MLSLNSVMIGTQQPAELAAFYERIFGEPAGMVDTEHGFWGWQVGACYFSILEHSEIEGTARDPKRILLNFETSQVQEEFERMVAAGATVVREPYDMEGGWVATLADPEGNYFQLVTPM